MTKNFKQRSIRKTILRPGANCTGIFAVEHTGILIDGRDYYKAFYKMARQAKRFILMAGWQFDSNVRLLRGTDLDDSKDEVRFIPFLNELCIKNSKLEVYILAWDFSVIFALEREWLQELITNWSTNERIHFRFDNSHAVGASHHQKFVVIDGVFAFAGGMDVCSSRWDDRRHIPENLERTDKNGAIYKPYHDVQAYLSGPIVEELVRVFKNRWRGSGGGNLPLANDRHGLFSAFQDSFPLAADSAALSQTRARTLVPLRGPIEEIRALYRDAIHNAEKLIYLENQYFSSESVYQAFTERMSAPNRPPLQVIMMLPKKPTAFVEEIALGIAQARMLNSLKGVAKRNGHSLGIYYSTAMSQEGNEVPTYIHTKLLLTDDRFLTIGSANTTNRSMGLDTELNVSWEANTIKNMALFESIREFRVSLLAEHTGLSDNDDKARLSSINGIVDYLNHLADTKELRLRHHTANGLLEKNEWLRELEIDQFSFDPDKPILEENIFEAISQDRNGLFTQGIQFLNNWLFECRRDRVTDSKCLETGNDNNKFFSFLHLINPVRYLRYFKWGFLLFFVMAAVTLLIILLRLN